MKTLLTALLALALLASGCKSTVEDAERLRDEASALKEELVGLREMVDEIEKSSKGSTAVTVDLIDDLDNLDDELKLAEATGSDISAEALRVRLQALISKAKELKARLEQNTDYIGEVNSATGTIIRQADEHERNAEEHADDLASQYDFLDILGITALIGGPVGLVGTAGASAYQRRKKKHRFENRT